MRTAAFNMALLMDRIGRALPPCLYALGVGVLATKTLSLPVPAWALVFAAVTAAMVWTFLPLAARGGWYSREYALAWLDLHNRAGGAIMTGGDAGLPLLRVKPGIAPGYLANRLVLPAVFLAAAWLVPAPSGSTEISGAGVERAAARMEREVLEAEERELITRPDAEELRRQVQRLRELAAGNPEAAAEAMNMLPERLDAAKADRLDAMTEAVNKAAGALSDMNRANAADADADAGMALDKSLGDLFSALERMAQNEGGLENLPPELGQAIREALEESGAESLREMAGGAGGESRELSREALEKIMRSLSDAGGSMAGNHQEQGQGQGQGQGGGSQGQSLPSLSSLQEALENLEQSGVLSRTREGMPGAGTGAGDEPGGAGEQSGNGGQPGSGGVSRGPGEAPLLIGRESEQAGKRFDPVPLPPGEAGMPGEMLRRERVAPSETLPPEEFRTVWRSAVDAPRRVHAGDGGGDLGPERARSAERYFMKLGETQ